MNFILLGYIIAWLGVIYVILVIVSTYKSYIQLTDLERHMVESINLTKELLILVIGIAYIIVYHIS